MATMNEQFDNIQQALYNAEYDDFVMDSLKFAVSSLLKVAIAQQAEIDALKAQVARLVEATPSAGVVEEREQ